MDLGWVGMTSVWSEKVRTPRWTSRWTSSRTTGGTSGSTRPGMDRVKLRIDSIEASQGLILMK